jgi:hypothetical protein
MKARNEGWEPPLLPNVAAAATVANLGNGWNAWPQEGELVDQNELQQVQALADELVQEAMLNHPNAAQVSESISSEVLDYYRSQGQPIRLELPLVQNHQAIVPYYNNNMDKESDYPIFQLARTLNLHLVFGPMPSAQMIIEDILHVLMSYQHNLYVPRPLNIGLSQFSYMQRCHYILGKQP